MVAAGREAMLPDAVGLYERLSAASSPISSLENFGYSEMYHRQHGSSNEQHFHPQRARRELADNILGLGNASNEARDMIAALEVALAKSEATNVALKIGNIHQALTSLVEMAKIGWCRLTIRVYCWRPSKRHSPCLKPLTVLLKIGTILQTTSCSSGDGKDWLVSTDNPC